MVFKVGQDAELGLWSTGVLQDFERFGWHLPNESAQA